MNELVTKICKKCGQAKPIEEFSKDARSRDGHSMYCKDCTRDISRKSYEKMKMRREAAATANTLAAFTPRDLLAELKRRGYKWEKMYCLQEVKFENI